MKNKKKQRSKPKLKRISDPHFKSVPGTLTYNGDKPTETLKLEVIDYNAETFDFIEESNIKNVFKYKDTPTISWINIDGLNHTEQIEKIAQFFELHPLVIEDLVNTKQRPKYEEFNDYIVVVLKMMYYDEDNELFTEQVSFVLGENYLLTFQECKIDVFDSVRERLRYSKGRIRTLKTDYLLYALVDAIVDHYFVVTEVLGNKIEELEDEIFSGVVNENYSEEIQDLKKELLKVRRSTVPTKEIVSRLEHSKHRIINETTLNYFRDILDHSTQVSDSIDLYRETLWSLMDMYMTTISNKMNEVMKVLTIIATIFIPLTFIAGVYGMNFENIPELKYKNGYFVLWSVMIGIFIIMFIFFKRKKWF